MIPSAGPRLCPAQHQPKTKEKANEQLRNVELPQAHSALLFISVDLSEACW